MNSLTSDLSSFDEEVEKIQVKILLDVDNDPEAHIDVIAQVEQDAFFRQAEIKAS